MHQLECYEAAVLLARTEGFIPAPETSHAIAAAIERGEQGQGRGQGEGHPLQLSGHGLMDLTGYDKYFQRQAGGLFALPQEEIDRALEEIKDYPKPAVARTGRW